MTRKPTPTRTLVELVDGDHWLTHGVIDDEARWVFMHGFCDELAAAIHDHTGWLIIRAGTPGDVGLHYGVLTPDYVVDIEGVHNLFAWAEPWGGRGTLEAVDPSDWLGGYPAPTPQNLERVRATATFVKPLLDSVGASAPVT
jgi:hypothetical protein